MDLKTERQDLKNNFLKKVIIRIDYTGILDLDLEETVKELKDILFNAGFKVFQQGYINEVNFEIRDPEKIETQLSIPINELKKNKNYIFINNDLHQSIQITKFFAFIDVNFGKYINFENYAKVFSQLVRVIKEKNKFIRILRIGLRKINNCILFDISKLGQYFNEKYFSNVPYDLVYKESNINLTNSQKLDTFTIKDMNVNLVRYIVQGMLQKESRQETGYQVVLDIDVYLRDETCFENILDSQENLYDKLVSMNTLLFFLYLQMLKENFIQNLKSTDFNDKDILGVVNND